MSEKVIEKNGPGNEDTNIHQTNGNGRGTATNPDLQRDTERPAELHATELDPDESAEDKTPADNGKRRRIFIIAGIAALLLVIVGTLYWLYSRQFESTDDAFVEADITQV